jgi:MYXO-CTERM domain-containing protein
MLAAVTAYAGPAAAYCRTTTASIPQGYDPTHSGCITEGMPIAWPSMPVTYEVNQAASKQISLADAQSIFDAAFASWAAVTCDAPEGGTGGTGGAAGGGEHPALSFDGLAPIDTPYDHCPDDAQACAQAEAAGPHQIIFRDDAWPYDDVANTIALTTVTYGQDDGYIFSANMEINSHQFHFSTSATPPAGYVSLGAVARHEAGHFIGLAHSQLDTAAMFAFYEPGMTGLTPDDVDGVCAVYPPSSGGCSCSAAGRADGGLGAGVGVVALAAAALGRRRRPGRSPVPPSRRRPPSGYPTSPP